MTTRNEGSMRGIKHPLTNEIYEVSDDGENIIVSGSHGSGTFTFGGKWISGELKHADPHLCGWLGSERGENRFRDAENRTRRIS
ncbi:MAG: hypothetical protein QF596_05450 [Acidimicrobiales bacterium]|nr:hypothetical protein [Acidimicrobiales bacterium]MDP6298808.1 hypothetical protein [Acidimicrobiales bacterium]HJM97218.1 hypothetical protein [Acidimicrobiales bacterium]